MTLMSYAPTADLYRAFAQLMVEETFTPPERRFAVGAAYLRGRARKALATGARSAPCTASRRCSSRSAN
jgi:predicted anti-sigma-YlaC factor YlaD